MHIYRPEYFLYIPIVIHQYVHVTCIIFLLGFCQFCVSFLFFLRRRLTSLQISPHFFSVSTVHMFQNDIIYYTVADWTFDIYLTNESHRYMLTLKKIPIAKNKFHSKFIDLKINWMKTKTTKVNGSIRGLWWFRQNIPPPFGSLRFTGLTEPHLCN